MIRTLSRSGRFLLVTLMAAGIQLTGATAAHAAAPDLEVSKTTDLKPKGETVRVKGSGYERGVGLYVVACDPAVENGGACDMANFTQAKADAAGAFDIELTLVAKFGTSNCLEIPCAIMTSKIGDGADRTQEAVAPIAFKGGVAPVEAEPSESATASAASDEPQSAPGGPTDDSGLSTPLVAGGGVLIVLLVGSVLYLRRKKTEA